jgi:hypothetical protein
MHFSFLLCVETGSGDQQDNFPVDRRNCFSGIKLLDLDHFPLSGVDVMNE